MSDPQLAPLYRVIGALIPVVVSEESDQALIAGAPIEVDVVMRSTDPAFPERTAGWIITLGYAGWRWETPPTVTRLEEA